jgi:hypothetical protein
MAIAKAGHLPRAAHTGRVTQTRVALGVDEAPPCARRWSLVAAVFLTIAFPILFAAVTASHRTR